MHRPGYVPGGQEANRGYLLLGIYHRRIPGDSDLQRKTPEHPCSHYDPYTVCMYRLKYMYQCIRTNPILIGKEGKNKMYLPLLNYLLALTAGLHF